MMNNETNKQVETFEKNFFDWLLSEPSSQEVSVAGDGQIPMDNREETIRVEELYWEELDPLDSEEIDFPCQNESQPLISGEAPSMLYYNRFESLLQKRLKAEIAAKPPRFPWEEPGHTTEYPDVESQDWVPQNLWGSQIKNIRWRNLSIPLTESVFAQILQSCQEIINSDLLPGRKLLRAVDNLFPGQSQSLNNLAGLVLVGPARDGELISAQVSAYDTATPKQQMLLSLLAAKEILASLSLSCNLNQSITTRQWETLVGSITIEAEYSTLEDNSATSLKVKAQVPEGATLQLQGRESCQAISQRSNPGTLWVELLNPEPEETYELIIKLLNWEQPLKFVVSLNDL
ncbi:MAG: hypothetical protein AB4080_09410 [Trichodesmium sp.]